MIWIEIRQLYRSLEMLLSAEINHLYLSVRVCGETILKRINHIDISPFRHLYPFKSRFMDLNGLKCHYLDEGNGDPVVMIHGNPTWSFYFRELVKGLSPRYRTIVPDHIGCGLSDKPGADRYDYRLESRVDDLEKLVDHIGTGEKITLVLHDWGGMIGMAYAVRHPERVARIVVMNTAAFFPPGGKSIPMRLRLVRNVKPFATLAVLGFNLFALGALFMAPRKRLPRMSKQVSSRRTTAGPTGLQP